MNVNIVAPPGSIAIAGSSGVKILVDGEEPRLVRKAVVTLEVGKAVEVELTHYVEGLAVEGEMEVKRIAVCPMCQGTMEAGS